MFLVPMLLAAVAHPQSASIEKQATRCGIKPSQLVWTTDTAGQRGAQITPNGNLDSLPFASVKCLLDWAKKNGARVGFISEPPWPPKPAPLDCSAFLANQHKLMESIDANRDGVIDRAEWKPVEKRAFDSTALIDKMYNSTSDPDDITRMFSDYDADSNGLITFQELNKGLCQS